MASDPHGQAVDRMDCREPWADRLRSERDAACRQRDELLEAIDFIPDSCPARYSRRPSDTAKRIREEMGHDA